MSHNSTSALCMENYNLHSCDNLSFYLKNQDLTEMFLTPTPLVLEQPQLQYNLIKVFVFDVLVLYIELILLKKNTFQFLIKPYTAINKKIIKTI